MGGYIQGAGHSPMSSMYGTGADQVLSMEVVTADGRFVTASETSNPDLFWALRGGGGSTYGVATSVVVKVYPKIPVTIMSFELETGDNISADKFWDALRVYFDGFIKYAVGYENYEYFRIANNGPGTFAFDMRPWWAPNMTKAQLQELVAPLFAQWKAMGVTVDPVYEEFDNYYDAWWAGFPLEPFAGGSVRTASRLFPKSNWEDPAKRAATFNAIRSVVEEGGYIIAFNIAAAPKSGFPDNAVNPAWRQTVMHCIVASFWAADASEAAKKAASDQLTFDWMKRWIDVSPGAGAYMSEADYIEPDFQQSFYGTRYPRLLDIKRRLDPYDVFYAQTAVGSEFWQMSEMFFGNVPSQNSKLCRKR